MSHNTFKIDPLFTKAEQLASDLSLFGKSINIRSLSGVLADKVIREKVKYLRSLSIDQYIAKTVFPAEEKSRSGAKEILQKIGGRVLQEISHGPLYAVELELVFSDEKRRIGFLAQERTECNGVWLPEHHMKAVEIIQEYTKYSIPLVTLIDTPGADAGEEANRSNQAHSISRLIAEMSLLDIPTVGIILGNGYSGGAIPLATTNILLSVRDGVFNTIQPRGLSSIARKYNLSWQECATYVGISSYELYDQGYIDGIIDFSPNKADTNIGMLKQAIQSAIHSIECNVKDFIRKNPYVFDHYQRSVDRYLNPSTYLSYYQERASLPYPMPPTSHMSAFGLMYRYLRYLSIRKKIRSTTMERYGRLSKREIPKGDLNERLEKEHQSAFEQWLGNPLEIKYDTTLKKAWKEHRYFKLHLHEHRGKWGRFILGDPIQNYKRSLRNTTLCFGYSLYNLWKTGAQDNFLLFVDTIRQDFSPNKISKEVTVLDVLLDRDIVVPMINECRNLMIFDLIYDYIINNISVIAKEAKEANVISQKTTKTLIEGSIDYAVKTLIAKLNDTLSEEDLRTQFMDWLRYFIAHPKRSTYLTSLQSWKKIAYPRIPEPLFAIITFFFEHLLPSYDEAQRTGKAYQGRITPRNIGIKDFWNRLTIAYHDLLLQKLLEKRKRSERITATKIIEKFFVRFRESRGNLMTCDPVNFPGFRISIEDALSKGIKPCGILTGTAFFNVNGKRKRVGIVVSNLEFQAGAFDMASAEKFCRLLVTCSERKLPVICFISSGGMQTKEGAGALFSMTIVNDRITRFVRDNDLPIICFGFGDCTGGAQASFVTHPLVQTYYFSGTNMPFAGQIVVPSYLPYRSTLSNYLSLVPNSMQGLAKHPFYEDIDNQLQAIDPEIPTAKESVEEIITRVLQGELFSLEPEDSEAIKTVSHLSLMSPIKRVLIHARGCTAVKLIRDSHIAGINLVLVQSDVDMDSVAAEMLAKDDILICLGGNTPDESYLNALSVVRIAEQENVDAIHPGIGFLSENPQFSYLCRNHYLNFIGPSGQSMELMGNKSNAINTALSLGIPVIPGSHGIVTSPDAAIKLTKDIGYPVVIKAVYGGGGKGICRVDSNDNFREIFLQMMVESKSAFGNSDVYIEKYISSFRHIEVQILGDSFGTVKILGLRDCSVQRNHQKIIEESASTALPKSLQKKAFSYAETIAKEIQYTGAGTVEFIYDLSCNELYFMEMNTRLQVEHPVTEAVTSTKIIAAQYDIASGKNIKSMKIAFSGYAMEIRVNAEKIAIGAAEELIFIPHPGTVKEVHLPLDDDIECISAIAKGKSIPPYYDSMIVQIICKGKDRIDTINKLIGYLEEVVIQGVYTNIPLLKRILRDDTFQNGNYDTSFLTGFLENIDQDQLIKEMEEFAGETEDHFDHSSITIEDSDELKVLSHSSGIVYLTPSPSDPPFIVIGDLVRTDKTLCLTEAMKIFRPLSMNVFNKKDHTIYEEDVSYEIVKINITNAQAVSAGDLLFIIKKA